MPVHLYSQNEAHHLLAACHRFPLSITPPRPVEHPVFLIQGYIPRVRRDNSMLSALHLSSGGFAPLSEHALDYLIHQFNIPIEEPSHEKLEDFISSLLMTMMTLWTVIRAARFVTVKTLSSDGSKVCQTRPTELPIAARTYRRVNNQLWILELMGSAQTYKSCGHILRSFRSGSRNEDSTL
jgi:hypothetical protein